MTAWWVALVLVLVAVGCVVDRRGRDVDDRDERARRRRLLRELDRHS